MQIAETLRRPSYSEVTQGLRSAVPTIEKLPNGLTILHFESPSPFCSAHIIFPYAGSAHGSDAKGHITEHQLLAQTQIWRSPQLFDKHIEEHAGQYNATTRRELAKYFVELPYDSKESPIRILGTIFTLPYITRKSLGREKNIAIVEALEQYEDPMSYAYVVLARLIWPDHAFGIDPVGSIDAIKRLRIEHIQDYIKTHYIANGAVLSITGNISESRALEHAQSSFYGLPMGDEPSQFSDYIDSRNGTLIEVIRRPIETTVIAIALSTNGIGENHAARNDIDTLAQYLDIQLHRNFKYQRGSTYSLVGEPWLHKNQGRFVMSVSIPSEHANFALRTLMKIYYQDRFNSKDVGWAIGRKVYMLNSALETSLGQARLFGQQMIDTGQVYSVEELEATIRGTNTQNLKAQLQAIRTQPARVVVIGPHNGRDQDQFEKILYQYQTS